MQANNHTLDTQRDTEPNESPCLGPTEVHQKLDNSAVQIDVVAGLLGLNHSPTSISYLTGWSEGDADTIRATAGRVFQAVHSLSDGLISEETEQAAV